MTSEALKELVTICSVIKDTVDTEKIYLFGSHAYGFPTQDSDYDLCVVIPDHPIRPVDAIIEIRTALFYVQNTPLDVIVYHSSDFQKRASHVSLEQKIAQDGILLYDQHTTADPND